MWVVVERKKTTTVQRSSVEPTKGAANEMRQVYGYGCASGNDGGRCCECRRNDGVGNDRGYAGGQHHSIGSKSKRTVARDVRGDDASRVAV